ncbi:hypothetical protein IV498_01030 [Paenarthrobacter sp. Z7-10]|uniref:septum site-determining protein Ssd n=1 Tax=Paenarthrobacter sp. Z7-10 TaxID=2787635 RepID=UPI0022A9D6ED|nr:septum site-determining protein Ssd [Paenarthrobacter sp. Z7-10]MCZ2401802.1 hypothetical protein [Paenarthrobacter sp. Z7-10]
MSSGPRIRGRRAAAPRTRADSLLEGSSGAQASFPTADRGSKVLGREVSGPGARSLAASSRAHGVPEPDPGALRSRTETVSGRAGQWLPEQRIDVLLVTESSYLRDEAARISAAAAVELAVAATIESAGVDWHGAGAVLVGSDISEPIPRRRGPTVLIGASGESETLWQQASISGVDRVAVLPHGSEWLAEFLGRLRDPASTGFVLGIVGGCGGAGASTLSVLMAGHAAGLGIRTLLVDGDEWGGGLDLAVGGEDLPGLRWPDLQAAAGSLNPGQLAAALPVVAGFSLLTWGQQLQGASSNPQAQGLNMEVLKASRRGYELTVVDVGRSRDALAGLGQFCDQVLVVVPARMRSAVASAQLLAHLPPLSTSVVIRGPIREGLDADLIGGSIGVPVTTVMPAVRGLTAAAERGQLLDFLHRRSIRRVTGAVLAELRSGDQ